MSIFDKLKNPAAQNGNKSETFSFSALPESVEELKKFPEAALDTPFKTAALTICALCTYAADANIGIEMLNFLKGPQPLSEYDKSFLKDRIRGKTYVPFSYFSGTSPENDYTPTAPFTVTVSENPHSYEEEGYAKLFIKSSGADSERPVKLRKKGEQWFLWEQLLMADIRKPKSQDPWA